MRTVVLAGAGASYAVDKESFPTTLEFARRLPENVTRNQLFKLINQVAVEQKDEPIDIEKVLWKLDEVRSHIAVLTQPNNTVMRMYSSNRMGSVIGGDTSNIVHHSANYLLQIDSLISAINEVVYEFYSKIPTQQQLSNNWIPLFGMLNKHASDVQVFTTNYDRVIESAIKFMPTEGTNHQKIGFGYTDGVERELDLSNWQKKAEGSEGKTTDQRGLLTKLHGSVDWSRENKKVVVGGAFYKGSHSRHAILYPGLKGWPEIEPFKSFQAYLGDTLGKATHVVIIGFALRDEAINFELDNAASNSHLQKIIVVDPAEKIGIDQEDILKKMTHIKTGFNAEAVKQVEIELRAPMSKAA